MNRKIGMSLMAVFMVACIGVGYFFGSQQATVQYITVTVPEQGSNPSGVVSYWVKRAGSDEWVLIERNTNIVVTQGLTLLRDYLRANADAVGWKNVTAISLSTSATAPDATWTVIPTEITTGGLERIYASSVTNKNSTCYNCTHTFTSSATHTDVQLSGLNWNNTSNGASLWAANTFTATTLYSADQLKIEKETTCEFLLYWLVNTVSG